MCGTLHIFYVWLIDISKAKIDVYIEKPTYLPAFIPILISHPTNQRLLAPTGRHPLTALPRLHLADIHRINLLQRPPLRLAHEEIHNQHSREVAPREDVPVFESNVRNDKGGEECDEEVPDPVGRGYERHAAGAVVGGEEFADDAPDDGAPRRGVKGDEDAREDDHGGAGAWGGGGIGVVEREGADGGEDEETGRHADTAYDQSPSTTEALHDVETEEGHAEVDPAEDHGCHEAVVDACGFEDGCTVVEEKICSCQLLESLEDYTESGTVGHPGTRDQFDPRTFAQ